jgi:Mrp family chromosome partitioning ATPase
MIQGELASGGRLRVEVRPTDLHIDPAPESLSLLALRLRGDLRAQGHGRSILVAAADDDTAAQETVLELAWCLAEELGHTVLLVDSAFGDRSMSAALGLADVAGLAECLDEPAHPEKRLDHLTRATRHARISALPQGDPAGASTIRDTAVQRLLELACQRHDFVLVRSSIRAEISRSLAFSSLVDAALLIAVEEQTTWDQIKRGQQLLNDCGARRVALVLAHRSPLRRRQGR